MLIRVQKDFQVRLCICSLVVGIAITLNLDLKNKFDPSLWLSMMRQPVFPIELRDLSHKPGDFQPGFLSQLPRNAMQDGLIAVLARTSWDFLTSEGGYEGYYSGGESDRYVTQ